MPEYNILPILFALPFIAYTLHPIGVTLMSQVKSVKDQYREYRKANPRQFTPREVAIFINGMAHARNIATGTTRGHIAAQAINTEMTTLALHAEQKGCLKTVVRGWLEDKCSLWKVTR